MIYRIDVPHLGNNKALTCKNERGEEIFTRVFENDDEIVFTNHLTNEKYDLNYEMVDHHHHYNLIDKAKNEILHVKIGNKFIHTISYQGKDYVCKSALLRMHYIMYDENRVIGELNIKKNRKTRYYEIDIKKESIEPVMALFILSQTVRTIADRTFRRNL